MFFVFQTLKFHQKKRVDTQKKKINKFKQNKMN